MFLRKLFGCSTAELVKKHGVVWEEDGESRRRGGRGNRACYVKWKKNCLKRIKKSIH